MEQGLNETIEALQKDLNNKAEAARGKEQEFYNRVSTNLGETITNIKQLQQLLDKKASETNGLGGLIDGTCLSAIAGLIGKTSDRTNEQEIYTYLQRTALQEARKKILLGVQKKLGSKTYYTYAGLVSIVLGEEVTSDEITEAIFSALSNQLSSMDEGKFFVKSVKGEKSNLYNFINGSVQSEKIISFLLGKDISLKELQNIKNTTNKKGEIRQRVEDYIYSNFGSLDLFGEPDNESVVELLGSTNVKLDDNVLKRMSKIVSANLSSDADSDNDNSNKKGGDIYATVRSYLADSFAPGLSSNARTALLEEVEKIRLKSGESQFEEIYDVNTNLNKIKGMLGEIYTAVMLKLLGFGNQVLATGAVVTGGANLQVNVNGTVFNVSPGKQIPIDIICEAFGFQVKQYTLSSSGEATFKEDVSPSLTVMNKMQVTGTVRETLINLFRDKYLEFTSPGASYTQSYNSTFNPNEIRAQAEPLLAPFAGTGLGIDRAFTSAIYDTENGANLAKSNTFFIVNSTWLPASVIFSSLSRSLNKYKIVDGMAGNVQNENIRFKMNGITTKENYEFYKYYREDKGYQSLGRGKDTGAARNEFIDQFYRNLTTNQYDPQSYYNINTGSNWTNEQIANLVYFGYEIVIRVQDLFNEAIAEAG